MKVCKNCKEEKEAEDFYLRNDNKDGLRNQCKACDIVRIKNHSKTKEGKLKAIYDSQTASSKHRRHESPTYTKKEFVDRFINDLDYIRHYYSWCISNYSKKYSPSFDRKDDYKGYSFENIQIMYWFENNEKGNLDIREGRNNKQAKGVIGTNIKTGEKIEFHSIMEAERGGFASSHVSNCCLGRVRQHKGYFWKYK